jgi:hypothetical protein
VSPELSFFKSLIIFPCSILLSDKISIGHDIRPGCDTLSRTELFVIRPTKEPNSMEFSRDSMFRAAFRVVLRIAAIASVLAASSQTAVGQYTWDANGTGAGQTNGAGAWLGTNLWWNGSTNVTWVSGTDAVFGGPATAGGAVTLASPTTVGSLTFNTFTGTYTLGTAGQMITLNSGIM